MGRPVSRARYKRERREARAALTARGRIDRTRGEWASHALDRLSAFDGPRRPEGDAASYSEAPYFFSYPNSRAFASVATRVIEPDGRDRDRDAVPPDTSFSFLDEATMCVQRAMMESIRRTEEDLRRAILASSPLLDPGLAVALPWPPLPDANPDPRVYPAAPGELPAGVTPEAAASASDAWRAGRATPLDDVMSIRARIREIMGEIPGPPPRLCDCPRCNPLPPDPVRTLTLGGVTLFPSPYNLRLAGIGADLDTARSRARAVARTTLGKARWADLSRDGYLEVRDHLRPELLYRLTPGRAIEVYDDGHFASYLCVGPAVAMPVDEAFAQLYLYARDAPDELRRRGNWVEQSFRTPNAF